MIAVNSNRKDQSTIKVKLKTAFKAGVNKGWRNFWWMVKITVPISLAVALLHWTGWLYKTDFILNPAMKLLHLPSEAALPILSALFINIYATIAVLAVVPFSPGQMIMIAVFSLIAHNIITEAVIQHNSGMNGIKMVIIRVIVAVFTLLAISPFMGNTTLSISITAISTGQTSFSQVLQTWGIDTGKLLLKIFILIMVILVVLEISTTLKWDKYLFRVFQPFMKVLGLSDRSVVLWVTAALFGLMYGSAVILEKTKEGNLGRSELERLHISIGINHSMVEDPALYVAMGLNWFWLYIPKLLMAIVSVQFYRFLELLKEKVNPAKA